MRPCPGQSLYAPLSITTEQRRSEIRIQQLIVLAGWLASVDDTQEEGQTTSDKSGHTIIIITILSTQIDVVGVFNVVIGLDKYRLSECPWTGHGRTMSTVGNCRHNHFINVANDHQHHHIQSQLSTVQLKRPPAEKRAIEGWSGVLLNKKSNLSATSFNGPTSARLLWPRKMIHLSYGRLNSTRVSERVSVAGREGGG